MTVAEIATAQGVRPGPSVYLRENKYVHNTTALASIAQVHRARSQRRSSVLSTGFHLGDVRVMERVREAQAAGRWAVVDHRRTSGREPPSDHARVGDERERGTRALVFAQALPAGLAMAQPVAGAVLNRAPGCRDEERNG